MLPKTRMKPQMETKRREEDINEAILDVIAPMENFDFAPKRTQDDGKVRSDPHLFKAGPTYRQILACKSYPTVIRDLNWMSSLFTDPKVISTILCEPYEKSKIAKDIDTSDDRLISQLNSTRKSSKKAEIESGLDHSKTMLQMIGDESEPFFTTTVYCQVLDDDEIELRQHVTDFKDSLASNCSINSGVVSHNQRKAFLGASPLMQIDKTTTEQCAKPFPVSSLGVALPFSKSGLDDGCGTPIGHDDSGSLVRLDLQTTSKTRPNRNIGILGRSGVGKTTLLMKLISHAVGDGTTVIAVDPEREYRDLCKLLHGQWINLGGESSFSICPTAPRAAGANDDEQDLEAIYQATQNREVLTETVSTLRSFFALSAGCDRKEIDYLEQVFKTVYGNFGITYNTPLKDVDMNHYPLMRDILNEVNRQAKMATKSGKDALEVLAGKIWPSVEGSCSSLWGNRTTVKAESNFMVLDTHDLNNRDSAIKSAQYFNVTTWIWDQVVRSRITGNNILIIIDEAHLVLNKEMESAAQKINEISKRIRKYNGGLVCATQQVKDISTYGEAILDQATYRFLLANDGLNLQEEKRIFNLSDDVAFRLEKGVRGQGIVMAGSEKVWAEIDVLDYERPYVLKKEKVF